MRRIQIYTRFIPDSIVLANLSSVPKSTLSTLFKKPANAILPERGLPRKGAGNLSSECIIHRITSEVPRGIIIDISRRGHHESVYSGGLGQSLWLAAVGISSNKRFGVGLGFAGVDTEHGGRHD